MIYIVFVDCFIPFYFESLLRYFKDYPETCFYFLPNPPALPIHNDIYLLEKGDQEIPLPSHRDLKLPPSLRIWNRTRIKDLFKDKSWAVLIDSPDNQLEKWFLDYPTSRIAIVIKEISLSNEETIFSLMEGKFSHFPLLVTENSFRSTLFCCLSGRKNRNLLEQFTLPLPNPRPGILLSPESSFQSEYSDCDIMFLFGGMRSCYLNRTLPYLPLWSKWRKISQSIYLNFTEGKFYGRLETKDRQTTEKFFHRALSDFLKDRQAGHFEKYSFHILDKMENWNFFSGTELLEVLNESSKIKKKLDIKLDIKLDSVADPGKEESETEKNREKTLVKQGIYLFLPGKGKKVLLPIQVRKSSLSIERLVDSLSRSLGGNWRKEESFIGLFHGTTFTWQSYNFTKEMY